MITKWSILYCLIFFLLSSLNHAQIDFPLQVGNVWQYSEFGYISESISVKDTIISNGKEYTQITGNLFSGFFRKEGSKVFSYNTVEDIEFVKYDFSLKIGDTLQVIVESTDTTLITVSGSGQQSFWNSERNFITFFRDNLSSSADGEEIIADGIGIVSYSGESLFFVLSGAIINGVKYGNLVSSNNDYSLIANEFILQQNYPNPFNPSTTIEYTIPSTSVILSEANNLNDFSSPVPQNDNVKLIIYDVLGRKVATLVNQTQKPGNYSVHFDGNKLSSGIYYYKLNYGSFSKTIKMILLK